MADHTKAARSIITARSEVPTDMGSTHVGTEPYISPLLGLPCELLVHTASYLSPEDLFSLRLTCRRAEIFLFDSFSEEFFSDRRFMVTECLGCLINISKHPNLSRRLSKLTIGLDRIYSFNALPSVRGRDRNLLRDNVPARGKYRAEDLEELAVEQNWLVGSGQLQLLLGEALNRLPNIVELVIRDNHVPGGSLRPGSSQVAVSYGTAQILQRTGIRFVGDESHLLSQDQFPDMIFAASLLAAARSGKRLKSITVDIRKKDMGLSSSAFAIPKSLAEPLRLTLQDLRSLDLSVSFTYVSLGSFTTSSLGFLPWQPHYLFKLLEYTPNLVRLRVESKGASLLKDEIIGWLAHLVDLRRGKKAQGLRVQGVMDASLDRLAQAQRFQMLQHLELENMAAPASSLSKVLLHLTGSLRKLCLRMVGVSVVSDDDELDNNPRSPNAWTSMFRDMSESISLEEIQVSSLGHHTPSCSTKDNNRHQVAFLKSKTGVQSSLENGLLDSWSHAGSIPAMKSFLQEIAEKTVVICTNCKQRNSGYRTCEDILDENL
ncbi:uncharacterized protein F4807DRAFT_468308 [Annulohypoxylon truncatum]|uniref:uncharacterized protein n=1 Tax=Annulohypoxylon truncatum TaxID=327061 RepID=UPI0020080208|nr:uncharacterized protein F4807DRAFT_468308 [Annulohypoxylon truncatum]KAI1214400.1 hypothetical protein F4807DRAFT_468308 [Annulohypoxylon truncatum]